MVAHAYNSSTQEAESGGRPQVQGKTGLYCETFIQKQQKKITKNKEQNNMMKDILTYLLVKHV